MTSSLTVSERDLYQKPIKGWRPGFCCHPLLREAYQRARLREYFEKNWKSQTFSLRRFENLSPQIAKSGDEFERVRRDMLGISRVKSEAEVFRTIFGKDPQNPNETEAVFTPFGIVFIVSRRDYEAILPHSFADASYLASSLQQDKVLPPEFKERVSLVSRRKPNSLPATARHEYEHMYLALSAFGRYRKNFADEILAPAGETTIVQVKRFWDESHTPESNEEDLLGKARAVMEWWKESFLEAVVKDEIVAYCAQHCAPQQIQANSSFVIQRFTARLFYSEVYSFVSTYAHRAFGLSQKYVDCISRFKDAWEEADIESYQEEAGEKGISAFHNVIEGGIPLRVALELAHMIPVKDWPEKLSEVTGLTQAV